ncbi:hypothetical protein E2562_026308 [Oryza meyeriana var. granulata]|uniref:NB-ARC domain-containing protein n=1 Tax=Oryza meyeriana var. granulata TaxID=110450 RepID=A0A6G1C921_9ORYZ|nr:hypothetical protein E2562_026308 [Oryza meyeriana var. granulata]
MINLALSGKMYLLAVDNLYEPIAPGDFMYAVASGWTGSKWVISTTSREVCNRSMSECDDVYGSFTKDEIMVLILTTLQQSAKHIAGGQEEHWHRVAVQCFLYAVLLLPQYPLGDNDDSSIIITSDQLIRQWAAKGILTSSKPQHVQDNIHSKRHDDIYQVGNVILQVFHEAPHSRQNISRGVVAGQGIDKDGLQARNGTSRMARKHKIGKRGGTKWPNNTYPKRLLKEIRLNAWVSQLRSLIHFYKPEYSTYNFSSLKHLHLEYCPRLESIMPRESALPSLMTLAILSCYNLKAIFFQHHYAKVVAYQLPSL